MIIFVLVILWKRITRSKYQHFFNIAYLKIYYILNNMASCNDKTILINKMHFYDIFCLLKIENMMKNFLKDFLRS